MINNQPAFPHGQPIPEGVRRRHQHNDGPPPAPAAQPPAGVPMHHAQRDRDNVDFIQNLLLTTLTGLSLGYAVYNIYNGIDTFYSEQNQVCLSERLHAQLTRKQHKAFMGILTVGIYTIIGGLYFCFRGGPRHGDVNNNNAPGG